MVDDGVEVEAQGQARFDGGVQGLLHVGRKPVGHERVLCTFGYKHANAASLFDEPFIDEDRVSSDKPVELRRGADVFTGDRFSYDDRSGVAVLTGQVRGVLQPRR